MHILEVERESRISKISKKLAMKLLGQFALHVSNGFRHIFYSIEDFCLMALTLIGHI